jgi:hypothetical protein
VEKRLVLHAAVARRGADDAELEAAVGDALDDRLRVEDEELHVQLRVRVGEEAEERREHDAARPGGRADGERALELARRLLGEPGDDLLLELEEPLRRPVQLEAGLGGLDAAPRTVEELRPEPLLEPAHLQADCRLRDPEPLGRLRERAALHHLAERVQLARIHKRTL